MLLSGLIICFLSLLTAAVYAADGSMLLFYVSIALLAIGVGFSIPAAVATEIVHLHPMEGHHDNA